MNLTATVKASRDRVYNGSDCNGRIRMSYKISKISTTLKKRIIRAIIYPSRGLKEPSPGRIIFLNIDAS